jgi:hypothetical protein
MPMVKGSASFYHRHGQPSKHGPKCAISCWAPMKKPSTTGGRIRAGQGIMKPSLRLECLISLVNNETLHHISTISSNPSISESE